MRGAAIDEARQVTVPAARLRNVTSVQIAWAAMWLIKAYEFVDSG
jgi:hypothetical protein